MFGQAKAKHETLGWQQIEFLVVHVFFLRGGVIKYTMGKLCRERGYIR